MGFFDKLKNVGNEVLKASGVTITKLPVSHDDEEEFEDDEIQEELQQEEEILTPSCENGDCWWFGGKFYFTCLADCACERKTYTKKDWAHDVPDTRLIPYMKRLEKANFDQKEKLYKDFMREFLSQYGSGQWGMAEAVLNGNTVSPMAGIAFWLGEQPFVEDMVTKLRLLKNVFVLNPGALYNPVFKSLSLYNRSEKDFEYSINIISVVLNNEKLQECYVDISNISLDQLLDESGNVLKAGIGGPKNGFYGKCIYNVVESWSGEDGENEVNR